MQTDTPKGKIDTYIFNNPSLMVLFGTLLGGGFVLSLGAEISAETREYLLYALTAIITLFASAMALFGTFRLVNHQKEIEAENRRRKLDAARASLPQALSDVISVAKATSSIYRDIRKFWFDTKWAKKRIAKTKTAEETIGILKDCIENSNDPATTWLSIIISKLQIMKSSLETLECDPHLITVRRKASGANNLLLGNSLNLRKPV